jgi:hypothetical protein
MGFSLGFRFRLSILLTTERGACGFARRFQPMKTGVKSIEPPFIPSNAAKLCGAQAGPRASPTLACMGKEALACAFRCSFDPQFLWSASSVFIRGKLLLFHNLPLLPPFLCVSKVLAFQFLRSFLISVHPR